VEKYIDKRETGRGKKRRRKEGEKKGRKERKEGGKERGRKNEALPFQFLSQHTTFSQLPLQMSLAQSSPLVTSAHHWCSEVSFCWPYCIQ
jgi:hypothetical protein